MQVGRIELGPCQECGLGGGTHRGSCSHSEMRGGTPFLALESQAVMGDRVIDMLSGKEIPQQPSLRVLGMSIAEIGQMRRVVDGKGEQSLVKLRARLYALRRELLIEARAQRRIAWERAEIGGRSLYARGLRYAAHEIREMLR